MDKNDFGYFGKGITGYTHYMLAFDRKNGGKKPSGGRGGCLSCLLLPLIIALIFFLI